MIANSHKALLLATSNKSEAAVGYTTMDGDTSGGLSPIADVPKSLVSLWLYWARERYELKSLELITASRGSLSPQPFDENDSLRDENDSRNATPVQKQLDQHTGPADFGLARPGLLSPVRRPSSEALLLLEVAEAETEPGSTPGRMGSSRPTAPAGFT